MRKKCYLSHPIQGVHRNVSEVERNKNMQYNNTVALAAGAAIRICCPHIDLYVPAEHEDFIVLAWKLGYLYEGPILDVDCGLIAQCDAVLFLNHQRTYSHGMRIEAEKAASLGLYKYTFTSLDQIPNQVKSFLESL